MEKLISREMMRDRLKFIRIHADEKERAFEEKNKSHAATRRDSCFVRVRFHLKILPWLNFFPSCSPSHRKY